MTRTIRLLLAAAVVGILGLVPATASANTVISPPSVAFPGQAVGSKSAAKTVTLTKDCEGSDSTFCAFPGFVSFSPTISVSGAGFSQTNNCPLTLTATFAATASCTISVFFSPAATGPASATLSTGSGGPTASLSGTGTPAPPKAKKNCKKKGKKGAAAAKKKCKKRKK